MMNSNFNFLRPFHPELVKLGESAERYIYSDPQSAVIKLRCFAELYVGFIYNELNLPSLGADSLFDRLNNTTFQTAVEQCVFDKLHLIRMKGNKAAHHKGVSINDALIVSKEAYLLAAWLYVAYHEGSVEDLPKYSTPELQNPQEQKLKQDKERLQENLNQQTANLQQAKAELKSAQEQQKRIQEQLEASNKKIDQIKLDTLQNNGHAAITSFDFQVENTRQQISIEDAFSEYQLTDSQAKLVEQLDDFLSSKKHSVFLLKGYAGTGKTFITKGLTEYFRSIGRNYVLAAPTGKAAKVISSKTGCEAYTIHKTIYYMKDIEEFRDDGLSGSETFKFYAQLAVNINSVDTVYIIDEASMISDIYNEQEFFRFGSGFLLADFLKYVNLDHNDHRKKVIFIGDNAQLPPVGMKQSPALDANYLRTQYSLTPISYELTEVVRQKAGSGVMQNAIKLRKALQSNSFNEIDIDVTAADITRLDHEDLVSAFMQSSGGRVSGKPVVIAASNADVTAYNKAIREELFPGQSTIAPRDKIMAVNNSYSDGFTITSGSFGQVLQLLGDPESRTITIKRRNQKTKEVELIAVPLSFRKVNVRFRDMEGEVIAFEAHILENLLYSDAPNLSSDENKALYVDFCIRHRQLRPGSKEFKDALASDPYFTALRLKFGYAITCHKAQGSEWEHVFIKCKTHHKQLSAEYFRWLYTAMTRTSDKLYLLEPPKLKLGSGIKIAPNPGLSQGNSSPIQDKTAVRQSPPMDNPSISTDTDSVISPERFGLQADSFLGYLQSNVQQCISGTGIDIHTIEHKQYQEAYIFCRGTQTARINITYNGKQKISSILAPQISELGNELQGLLAPLEGLLLTARNTAMGVTETTFSEPFLNEFHQRLVNSLKKKDITIQEASPQQYSLRYRFSCGHEAAAIMIYYNGKQQFTSCNPLYNLCNSPELMQEVLSTIEAGLT